MQPPKEDWRDRFGRFEAKEGWEVPYFEHLAQHGKMYLAAEHARVHPTTVWRRQQADSEFAEAINICREGFADRLEVKLEESGPRKENPVGFIVALKAVRPEKYLERSLSMNLNADVELEPAAGLELVQYLLAHATPATVAELNRLRDEPREALDIGKSSTASFPSPDDSKAEPPP